MRISDWSSDVCSSDLLTSSDTSRPRRTRRSDSVAKASAGMGTDSALGTPRCLSSSRAAWTRFCTSLSTSALGTSNLPASTRASERKSVVEGKRVSVGVDLGGRRILNKNKKTTDDSDLDHTARGSIRNYEK